MPGNGTGDRLEMYAEVSGNARVIQVGGNYVAAESELVPQVLAALPPAPVHLVGREDETDTLLGVLTPHGPGPSTGGVVAVTGLAGMGKSALALHTAHEAIARGWFPGGVLWLTLHGYDPAGRVTAEQALGMLLRGLGVPPEDVPPTADEQAARYQAELAHRAERGEAVLLVADDASSAAQILPLVPGRREHRMLITSRHTLASPSLTARRIGLQELAPAAAVKLLTDTLTRVNPSDPRPQGEAAAFDEIVGHCGHLPLALVIAAALLTDDPGLAPAVLADQLASARSRLRALHYDDHEGHSLEVRAAFELSYRRLDVAHAQTFRLLALNPGPDISTEAATVLISTPARPVLAALVRAGLLSEQPVGGNRWRMHNLLNLYAHELLMEEEQEEGRQECLGRLLEHYATTAAGAEGHLVTLPGPSVSARFASRAEALDWLEGERLNLIGAVTTAAATGHPYVTIFLTRSLHAFLMGRRSFTDVIALERQAISAALKINNHPMKAIALDSLGSALAELRLFDEAITAHMQAWSNFRDLDYGAGRATALTNLGNALREVRRLDEAIDAYTQALDTFRDLGDQHSEAATLINLGNGLQEVGRPDEAIDAYTQALDTFRDLGGQLGEATTLTNLGNALREVRRLDEAIATHIQSLDIYRELDDRHGEAKALMSFGNSLKAAGRFHEAIDAYTQALDTFRDLGDQHSEAMVLGNLGSALLEVRRPDDAINAYTQAADIFHQTGDQHREATARDKLGNTLAAAERLDEAIAAYTQAAYAYRRAGKQDGEAAALNNLSYTLKAAYAYRRADKQDGEAAALNNLSNTLKAAGRLDEAIAAYTQAADAYRRAGNQDGEAAALGNLGVACGTVERFDEAIAAYRQAADIFHQVGDQEGEAMALNNLGNTLRRVGRIEDAVGALTRAVEISRQADDQHSKARVLGTFGRSLEAAGRSDEAIAAYSQAADIFRQIGDRRCEATARDNLRRVRRFNGARKVWRSITGPFRRTRGPG